jgi:hypothetical protein
MDRKIVDSSNVISVGYDNSTRTLEVEFKGGSIYQYFDVPINEYEQLVSADSIGKYIATNIKGNYSFKKL